MDTTTPDEGAQSAQPDEPAAVLTGHNADQIITTDESGTPTLEPVASEAPAEEAAAEEEAPAQTEEQPKEAQAPADDKTDDEIVAWSEKKGLTIDPKNPNEVKLARMQLEAERKMHAANQAPKINPPELLETTGDVNYDPIVERQNELELKQYVRDWFDANPGMKEHRAELNQIAVQRPWLQDMDDVRAHFLANPSREADIKKQGGKEALTNLAQKQSNVPPASGATNSGVYASTQQITPQNVFQQVDSHDQAWFEKHHKAISDAMAGKTPQ